MRRERIEPSSVDFQSTVLPLNYPQYKATYNIYRIYNILNSKGIEPLFFV